MLNSAKFSFQVALCCEFHPFLPVIAVIALGLDLLWGLVGNTLSVCLHIMQDHAHSATHTCTHAPTHTQPHTREGFNSWGEEVCKFFAGESGESMR